SSWPWSWFPMRAPPPAPSAPPTRAPATGWRTALPTRPPAAAPPNPPIAAPFCVVLMLEQPRNPITSGRATKVVSPYLIGSPFPLIFLALDSILMPVDQWQYPRNINDL